MSQRLLSNTLLSFEPHMQHCLETGRDAQWVWAKKAAAFVSSIGITVVWKLRTDVSVKSTLPCIVVKNGGLEIYEGAFPGDILHEAGHLAVMPQPFRSMANGDLRVAFEAMHQYGEEHPDGLLTWPEDPVARAIMQCSDPEATAWQYAAAQEIGLPDEWLFPKDSFDAESESVLLRLKSTAYMGINGLQAAGWTVTRANPHRAAPVYPKLAFWLHPGKDLPLSPATESNSST